MEFFTPDILTALGTVITILGFCYAIIRNFRIDMDSKFDRIDKRMDNFEKKIISMEERMFWMATGKRLEDVILEEYKKGK